LATQRREVLGCVSQVGFEVSLDHGQLEHGQEVDGKFLETCGNASGVLQPPDRPLYHIAPSVSIAVEVRGTTSLATMRFAFFGNDGGDVTAA
jgi:hypothetical protein